MAALAPSHSNAAPTSHPVGCPPAVAAAISSALSHYPESGLVDDPRGRRFTLDDFEISPSLLGEGKFGRVFRAREKASRRIVVIKSIDKQAILEEDVKGQLQREVEVHCRLRHKNIVRLFAYFDDEDRVYLVLECVSGGNVYQRLQEAPGKRFPEPLAASLVQQLCLALEYCHAKGVIHRDIKPENLLLVDSDATGRGTPTLKLADFGWSVAQRAEARRFTLCGTAEYLPPEVRERWECLPPEEVCRGDEYAFGFDLWTVGVLAYEMLAGRSPFVDPAPGADNEQDALMLRIQAGTFRVPRGVSVDAADLIRRLLVQDQHARLSATAVLAHPWITKHCGRGASPK